MLSIILCMLAGIVAGYFVRQWKFPWLDSVMLYIIWLLLFELGLEVGGNQQILRALPTLGLSALEIAVAAMLGSCIAAFGMAKWIGRDMFWKKHIEDTVDRNTADGNKHHESPLKGSLIILAFFIVGCVAGYFGLFDNQTLLKDVSFYTLAVLIVLVGISIGNNREVLGNLKSMDRRLLLLPIFTIIGTLAACSLLWGAMGLAASQHNISDKLSDFLAIGSGQAYYSLSSILITQSRGIELGTIALLSNIIRELMTLLTAPLLVKVFGRLAPISAGGATTADTTLPIIRRVCGDDMAILSVYHGFAVDFSVPFMVTLFCSL
ncbi:MAG: lysine exporter LysO family protein [Bacteroidales bacterium]|nr:lysine exporter LysO family protein [Bacteroidales bacterium]MDD4669817.1 lysine exporter LysO family protein [Bacteroidales bacterium]